MTREEKQKAIDALKISAPIMVMTQEEFSDYIQTLNKIMDWLEQESILDKIRAEIEEPLKINQGLNTESAKAQSIALSWVLEVIDKYKGESGD